MKVKFLLSACLLFSQMLLFGQSIEKRFTMLIIIDDDIPHYSIQDGEFIIKSDINVIINRLKFDYHVGYVNLSEQAYRHLFSKPRDSKLFLKFTFRDYKHDLKESTYEGEIPLDWINDTFVIIRIYNKSKEQNKLRYVFGDAKYLFKVEIPGSENILKTWKSSVSTKHRLEQ